MNNHCLYYVAKTDRARGWFLSSTVRGTEHLCFDRCLDKENAIFEFFVPEKMNVLNVKNYKKTAGQLYDKMIAFFKSQEAQ